MKIAHDLTKTQRTEHKEMIDEAKEKDKEPGQENYIHLVRGPPNNMKIVRVPRNQ